MRNGDILKINTDYYDEKGETVTPHVFVVLNGLKNVSKYNLNKFDYVCVQLDGVHNDSQREKFKKYPSNYFIYPSSGVKIESYAKTNKLFLFDKNNFDYKVVGKLESNITTELKHQVEKMNDKINIVDKNLSEYREKDFIVNADYYDQLTSQIISQIDSSDGSMESINKICYRNNITYNDFQNYLLLKEQYVEQEEEETTTKEDYDMEM